jgi:8-oxo-dGTP pyrophosphatase MutT (NUDIX family)
LKDAIPFFIWKKKRIMFEAFIKELKQHLSGDLPGIPAQFEMAPHGRKNPPYDLSELKNFRESAVCIFLYERNGKIVFPLIERGQYEGVHSGQLGLPGGKIEAGDEDYIATAFREMEEETGIVASRQHVLGKLTDIYIPPSNFMVKPVVAWTNSAPLIKMDPKEVADVIELKIGELMDDALVKTGEISTYGGSKIKAPYFDVRGRILWGATAMMLNELKVLLRRNKAISSYSG